MFPPIPCSLSITRMLFILSLAFISELGGGAHGSALFFIAASRSHCVTLTLNFCSTEVRGVSCTYHCSSSPLSAVTFQVCLLHQRCAGCAWLGLCPSQPTVIISFSHFDNPLPHTWTLLSPNTALTQKLLNQNSNSLTITLIFPTCLQNYFHPCKTQGIKEQGMCVSYRLDHSQKEELGMNRACLSPFLKHASLDEKTQEYHSRDSVALSPLCPTSRLSYFGFPIKPFIIQGLTRGRRDWQSTRAFLLSPP